MVRRQPLSEEVEAALAAFRADMRPPAWPACHEVPIAEPADDLLVRGMLQQPDGRPVPVQGSELLATGEDLGEGLLVDVVVPNPGQTLIWPPGSKRPSRGSF